MAERAELISLRLRLADYERTENNIDFMIKGGDENLLNQSLVLNNTSIQRRIQESIALARELSDKTRELEKSELKIVKLTEENRELRDDLGRWEQALSSRAQLCSGGQQDPSTRFVTSAARKYKMENSSLKSENKDLRDALKAALDKISELEK